MERERERWRETETETERERERWRELVNKYHLSTRLTSRLNSFCSAVSWETPCPLPEKPSCCIGLVEEEEEVVEVVEVVEKEEELASAATSAFKN